VGFNKQIRDAIVTLQSNHVFSDDKAYEEFRKSYEIAVNGLVLLADTLDALEKMTSGAQAEFVGEDLIAVKNFIQSGIDDILEGIPTAPIEPLFHPWDKMVQDIEDGPNYIYPAQEPFTKCVTVNYVVSVLNRYKKYFTEKDNDRGQPKK